MGRVSGRAASSPPINARRIFAALSSPLFVEDADETKDVDEIEGGGVDGAEYLWVLEISRLYAFNRRIGTDPARRAHQVLGRPIESSRDSPVQARSSWETATYSRRLALTTMGAAGVSPSPILAVSRRRLVGSGTPSKVGPLTPTVKHFATNTLTELIDRRSIIRQTERISFPKWPPSLGLYHPK